MPIAAFTFGSFGDITVILQLAWAIRQSLSETSGAVGQVQTFIADIDTFTSALLQIKSSLSDRSSLPTDLMNGIALALEHCFKLLLRVKQRIDAYNSRMTAAVGASVLQQYWAAVAWEILGGKCEVDALRARLSEQVNVIQTLLAAAHCQNLEEIRKAAAAHSQTLEDVRKNAEATHRNVGEMFASMRKLCIRLSAISAPYTFFDASGAQLLPVGVIHVSKDKYCMVRNFNGDNPKSGTAGADNSLLHCHLLFRHDQDHGYSVLPAWNYLKPELLGEYPDDKHDIEVVFSFYCCGDDEDWTVFVSPVYATGRNKDTLRATLVPEASAALSQYVRCQGEKGIPLADLEQLLDQTAQQEKVRRLLRLE